MQAPQFWSRPQPTALARLLRPFGWLYSLIAEWRLRMVAPARPLVPVICIGNPTLGGAGKTPVAIAITARMKARGFRPGLLSRGYGADIKAPVAVDRKGTASQYGDEPLLLARVAPTVCSPNRAWGAETLAEGGADLIVMDDGFQNPTIAKDLSILVADGAAGLGNGLVFPAGPLRMRLAPQLARASALLILGDGAAVAPVTRLAERRGLPVIRARLEPDAKRLANMAGEKLVAYAGIGRPEKFFATLRDAGLDVVETHAFADHAPYSPAEAERLLAAAKAQGARLVTTEKDAVRLAGSDDPALMRLKRRSLVLPVSVVFDKVAAHQLDKLLDTLPGGGRRATKRKSSAKPTAKRQNSEKAIGGKPIGSKAAGGKANNDGASESKSARTGARGRKAAAAKPRRAQVKTKS